MSESEITWEEIPLGHYFLRKIGELVFLNRKMTCNTFTYGPRYNSPCDDESTHATTDMSIIRKGEIIEIIHPSRISWKIDYDTQRTPSSD